MEEVFKGWTKYHGVLAHQVEGFLPVWAAFLMLARPSRILEIGTADGGFILSLRHQMASINPECTVRSYDILAYDSHPVLIAQGLDIRVENVFTHSYLALLPEKKEEIVRFIQDRGTTVVICDGGSKQNEFNLLAPLLKDGDFILAHDYAKTRDHFDAEIKGKLWNWCEITENDIRAASLTGNLKPVMTESFESIVWVCRQKVPTT